MTKIITIWAILAVIGMSYTAVKIAQSKQQETDAYRGCVASAYQAERYGHDLEENLKACKDL